MQKLNVEVSGKWREEKEKIRGETGNCRKKKTKERKWKIVNIDISRKKRISIYLQFLSQLFSSCR